MPYRANPLYVGVCPMQSKTGDPYLFHKRSVPPGSGITTISGALPVPLSSLKVSGEGRKNFRRNAPELRARTPSSRNGPKDAVTDSSRSSMKISRRVGQTKLQAELSMLPEPSVLPTLVKNTRLSSSSRNLVSRPQWLKRSVTTWAVARSSRDYGGLEFYRSRQSAGSELPDALKQFPERPYVVGESRFHGGSDAQSLVDANEIVIGKVQGERRIVILPLLVKAFVSRVNRRICIRMVKF